MKTIMKNRNLKMRFGFIAIFLLGLISLIGSNHQGTYASAPDVGLKITSVSDSTPSIGDTVTITWEYENLDLLQIQGYRVVSLLIDGNLSVTNRGCLPFYPENEPCLDNAQRAVEIDFKSPVTIIIDAVDNDGRIVSKAVKLHQEGMSFELNQLDFTNPGYPRYTGHAVNASRPLKFDRAFGVYAKDGDPNLNVSTFRYFANRPALLQLFDSQKPFFGGSTNGIENRNFGFTRGANFPLLTNSFKNQLDDATKKLLEYSTRSTIVIYAGTIALNGQLEMAKGGDGTEVEIINIANDALIEPLFYQIDLVVTGSENNQIMHVSDVHLGNPVQGLVFSVYTGIIDQSALGTVGEPEISLNLISQQNISLSSGNIKGTAVSFQIITQTNGNDLIVPRVGISSNFQNIPIYPDTDLSPLFPDL